MKYLFAISLLFFSCSNDKEPSAPARTFPRPGTVVASAEVPISEDKLNRSVFTIKVIADSAVSSGVYDVDADFGANLAVGQFTMPKGYEDRTPLITKGKEQYTFIIGFRRPDDTTFYDYFEVSSDMKHTRMRYVKAYTTPDP